MINLYTIGHSNHEFAYFAKLLIANKIEQLVDVRSAPYSRYNLDFNREILEVKLKREGIEYFYFGKHLGGRPTDPSCYKHRALPGEGADYLHEVDYPEVMKKSWFKLDIQRLIALAERKVTTIMCSEENPAECHRHHMISKYLMAEYPEVTIFHVRGKGEIFNALTVHASVDETPADQPSLF